MLIYVRESVSLQTVNILQIIRMKEQHHPDIQVSNRSVLGTI